MRGSGRSFQLSLRVLWRSCWLSKLEEDAIVRDFIMPVFLFEAMDTNGEEVKDSVLAKNEEEAQLKIRQMGYFVTKIQLKGRSRRRKAGKRGWLSWLIPGGSAGRPSVWGVDFGHHSLKAIKLQLDEEKKPVAIAAKQIVYPRDESDESGNAQTGRPRKVFISHATGDRSIVEQEIINVLEKHGIKTWYCKEDIRGSQQWERRIAEGLKECDWFIVVLSPRSEKSEWVKDEVNWAIDNRDGRTVPVLLEDCDPGDFHIRLPRLQHIDFRTDRAVARGQLLSLWLKSDINPTVATLPCEKIPYAVSELLEDEEAPEEDVLCITHPTMAGASRYIKLPPVEQRKIADIARFEAKEQLPWDRDECAWDYRVVGNGVVVDGFAMETEIEIVGVSGEVRETYARFWTDQGLTASVEQLCSAALINSLLVDDSRRDPAERLPPVEEVGNRFMQVVMDIGHWRTTLTAFNSNGKIWEQVSPIAGQDFTYAIANGLSIPFEEAESLKHSLGSKEQLKGISNALKPVLSDFLKVLEECFHSLIHFYREPRIQKILVTGGGSQLRGLMPWLTQRINGFEGLPPGTKVERHAPQIQPGSMSSEDLALLKKEGCAFGPAYGVALQGLGLGAIQTNLCPKPAKKGLFGLFGSGS